LKYLKLSRLWEQEVKKGVKERVLKGLSFQQVVDILGSRKWNFFERKQVVVGEEEATVVKVEAPVGSNECYVVELGPYKDRVKLLEVVEELRARGFIEQEIRVTPD